MLKTSPLRIPVRPQFVKPNRELMWDYRYTLLQYRESGYANFVDVNNIFHEELQVLPHFCSKMIFFVSKIFYFPSMFIIVKCIMETAGIRIFVHWKFDFNSEYSKLELLHCLVDSIVIWSSIISKKHTSYQNNAVQHCESLYTNYRVVWNVFISQGEQNLQDQITYF